MVVDTSLDPEVLITRVYTTMEDGTYGVGEEILITVVFSAPVSQHLFCRPVQPNLTLHVTLHQTYGNPTENCTSRCSYILEYGTGGNDGKFSPGNNHSPALAVASTPVCQLPTFSHSRANHRTPISPLDFRSLPSHLHRSLAFERKTIDTHLFRAER